MALNHDADPLLDQKAPCAGCGHLVPPTDLCNHDREDIFPACLDLCCPHFHDDGDIAA